MIERKRPRRWCKGRVTKMFKAFLAEEEEEDDYEIVKVAPLGNCLWESCERCGVGNGISWKEIKKATTDHMLAKREQYEPFCDDTETLDQRIYKIRKANAWAGQLEMRAMSELYSVAFSLYQIEDRRVQVSQMSFCEDEPIHRVRVTYDGCHYNPILKKKPGSKLSVKSKNKKKKTQKAIVKKKAHEKGKDNIEAKKPESWSIRLRFRKRQQPFRVAKRKREDKDISDHKARKPKKLRRVSKVQRFVQKESKIFYFIEKLMEERVSQKSNGKEYLVKWKNYPKSQATWEPESEVSHSDPFKIWIKKTTLKKTRKQMGSHPNPGNPRKGAKWGYIGVSKFSNGFRGIIKLKKGGVKTTGYYNTALNAAEAREDWMKNNARLVLSSCRFNWG